MKAKSKYSRWNRINDPSVAIIEEYLKANEHKWKSNSKKLFGERIYRFYRWLEDNGISLYQVTVSDLEGYDKYILDTGTNQYTTIQYRKCVNTFLRWVFRHDDLYTTLAALGLEKEKHPFLEEHLHELSDPYAIKIHKIYISEFYNFLKDKKLSINKITKADINNYEMFLRNQIPARSVWARRINLRCVYSHIRWLSNKKILEESLSQLGILKPKFMAVVNADLPPVAKDFLRLAEGYRKALTIAGYKTNLKHFYKFLNDHQMSLHNFKRCDFEQFVKEFADQKYSPTSINHAICTVQIYLTWLYQCGHLQKDPEPLIQNFPRPKRPDSLPRYLLPEVDKILQEHLDKSKEIAAWGLNLMRRIGIRISDLKNLEYDCTSTDERGYSYIKIPIGKLYNERLFPLDEKTLELIKKIQKASLENNRGKQPAKLVIHERGKPVNVQDYYHILYEISEKIRLDHGKSLGNEALVSHRLRHTFATTLVNAGISIEALKELLGHKSISMTLRYGRVMPETLRNDYFDALKKIEINIESPKIKQASNSTEAIDEILYFLRRKTNKSSLTNRKIIALIRRTERLKQDLLAID